MGFADDNGDVYDVHITDDIESHGTWEYIDFKFSLPASWCIMIWRRDGKKFTPMEVNYVTKYVRNDMSDFIDEGKMNDDKNDRWHYRILKKLVDQNSCLVLMWDDLDLPLEYDKWSDMVCELKEIVMEHVKDISKPGSLHDREIDIYEGKIGGPLSPAINIVEENHKLRSNAYDRYQIPSDNVLREYFMRMKERKYATACEILAAHYEIEGPQVEMKDDLPGTVFVYYDFVNHTIVFSPLRMPEFWQQVPTLLAGFFRHLALSKDWKFSINPSESIQREKNEADRFVQESLNKLIEIGLDPRNENI